MAKGEYLESLVRALHANVICLRVYWGLRNSDHEWWGPYSRNQVRTAVTQLRRLRTQIDAATGSVTTTA